MNQPPLQGPPTSHSAADPAEFNAVCRSKSNLLNRTDSNAALLPYLTHQLGSAHEWNGVWNGPNALIREVVIYLPLQLLFAAKSHLY